ncbi:uncharacterized protein [Venturia canescens]|uniref:uncharacterized protein n=1 Tax=Venturia canescens TaxID=32260 RepID=UPI001C9C8776|nr:uncharacterized protein LOC122413672 [Venturia canescens]
MLFALLLGLAIGGISEAAPVFLIAQPATPYAHPGVLNNDALEDALPDELRNNFYKNPAIAAGLARESWLTPKETQVIDREADKIPRHKIFDVLHNAGLA